MTDRIAITGGHGAFTDLTPIPIAAPIHDFGGHGIVFVPYMLEVSTPTYDAIQASQEKDGGGWGGEPMSVKQNGNTEKRCS